MSVNDDRELRERFAALRDDDASGAPNFSRLLDGRRLLRPAPTSRWIPVAVLAAAAAATAILLVAPPRVAAPSIDEAIAQAKSLSSWTAPTDDWLTLSGLEIPSSVPSLSPTSVTLPSASAAAAVTGETR